MGASIETIIGTFSGISSDDDIAIYIELAKTQTSSCFFGSRYNQAVALRAAHCLVLSKPDVYRQYFSGGLTTKKQRNVTLQYGETVNAGGTDKSGLSQTTFGSQLLGLMRMSNMTINAIGAGYCGS